MELTADFTEICRTCLSEAKLMQTIFDVKVSTVQNVRLVDFIRRLTSIKIARSDGLPNNICVHCIDHLCNAFDFAEMCINNNFKLREKLKSRKLALLDEHILSAEEKQDNITQVEMIIDKDKEEFKPVIIEQIGGDIYNRDYMSSGNETKNSVQENIVTSHRKNYEADKILTHQYKCNITKDSSKAHIKHYHKKENEFVCNICSQKFNYLYLLNKHYYKHQDNKPFPCTFCNKGCITAESLRRHMKVHDKNYIKKIHVCKVCLKEFPYPSFLAEHMKNHTGERPFLCAICGKGFRQSGTLQYHMRSHTGSRPYVCNVCHSNFASPGVLKVHMRIHTNERPYVCDICGMAFRQSTDMKSHRRTHTGDKRALCTVCGKRFSSSSQLNIHIRSHTGEKPYLCASCSKSFSTKTMLVKHERIHTGERPYVCKVCSKAFNQSSTLKTHLNTHKPVKEPVGETVIKMCGENSDKVTIILSN